VSFTWRKQFLVPCFALFIYQPLTMAQDSSPQQTTPPAQQTTPPSQQTTTPGQPTTPPAQPPSVPLPSTAPAAPSLPENGPWPDTSDHQFSIMPYYWLVSGHPAMRTGALGVTNETISDLDYGESGTHQAYGAEISFPAGKHNTLRVDYFRTQGSGNTTATDNVTYFGLLYASGTYLTTSQTLQNVRVTWDYLSWPFPVNPHKLQVKSLWSVQYTTIQTRLNGPFLPLIDSAGNPLQTSTTGSDHIIYPEFGIGAEKFFGKHVRWEGQASGFAFPHRAVTWDGKTFIAIRGGPVEFDLGYKAFYFKTSPRGNEYVNERLTGGYVAIRWYPKF
jgi:hypothetical protein